MSTRISSLGVFLSSMSLKSKSEIQGENSKERERITESFVVVATRSVKHFNF